MKTCNITSITLLVSPFCYWGRVHVRHEADAGTSVDNSKFVTI